MPTSTSLSFYAGYYYPEAGSDTPDTLEVALDKTAYAVGDTAILKLDPQFAGTALVMVIDDRIIDMQAVDVPADGTSVSLPVTADWGPGAYVTAMLYRPADAAEKRMPARALGLAFADVDPGPRCSTVGLDVPAEAAPRQSFTANDRSRQRPRRHRRPMSPSPPSISASSTSPASRRPIRTAGSTASASSGSTSATSMAS